MQIATLIRDMLLDTLNHWREYIAQNRADDYSEKMEQILLFHATFSNLFDESLQNKVHQVHDFCKNRLELQPDKKLYIYDYAPAIILAKTFRDYSDDQDEWFHKIIQFSSSRSSSIRFFAAKLLLFYLHKNVDFKNEVCGSSLKDLLLRQALQNIEEHHHDNRYLFALITFLNLSAEERKELFATLLDFAQTKEASQDLPILQQLTNADKQIPNPFYTYLIACYQQSLSQILSLEFNPKRNKESLQLDLFNQPIRPTYHYNFEDVRLAYYLP